MEFVSHAPVEIIMEATVPVAFPRCQQLKFEYYDDKAVRIRKSDCAAFFGATKREHSLRVQAEQTPGCSSYTSVIKFQPFKNPNALIWTQYTPSDITVRFYDYCIYEYMYGVYRVGPKK